MIITWNLFQCRRIYNIRYILKGTTLRKQTNQEWFVASNIVGWGYQVFTEWTPTYRMVFQLRKHPLHYAKLVERWEGGGGRYVALHRRLPTSYHDLARAYRITTSHFPNDHSQITNYHLKHTDRPLRIYWLNFGQLDIGEGISPPPLLPVESSLKQVQMVSTHRPLPTQQGPATDK